MWVDNWSVSVHDSKNSPTLEQTPNNYQGGSVASIMLYSKTQFSISHIGSRNFENQITGYKFVCSFMKNSWVYRGFQNNQNLWFFHFDSFSQRTRTNGSQIQNIEKPATGGSLKIQLIAEHWFFLYSLDIDQQTSHTQKKHWLLDSVLATKKKPLKICQ